MHWFLKEQREEVSSMSDLLKLSLWDALYAGGADLVLTATTTITSVSPRRTQPARRTLRAASWRSSPAPAVPNSRRSRIPVRTRWSGSTTPTGYWS